MHNTFKLYNTDIYSQQLNAQHIIILRTAIDVQIELMLCFFCLLNGFKHTLFGFAKFNHNSPTGATSSRSMQLLYSNALFTATSS